MMVETVGLRKTYGSQVALDGVDLRVPERSVFGLVGPNGAGKTTLLGILAGLRRATEGSLRMGTERRRLALLPDTPTFDPWLTGREVVDLARTLTAPGSHPHRVEELLGQAGLADDADRSVGGYSRGMLQRLGLAATLAGSPEVLLLDEPASALDPAGRRDVLDLVARLRGEATVVLASHILGDVQEVADTVGILREGRLIYQGSLEDLLVGRAGPVYTIRLRPPLEPAASALRRQTWVEEVEEAGPEDLRVVVRSIGEAETRLPGVLSEAGAAVVRMGPESADLERAFLELTS
jgi:ABC-2 type transport system ATP-binding protein